MQTLLLKGDRAMKIEEYQFGSITIDGQSYTSDVIISPDGVDATWWRERGHELSVKDLEPVLAAKPDILIIGTGESGCVKVLPEAAELMRRRCAQVHVLKTAQACRRFNELVAGESRRVVAALHLTC